jgi:hypothetical protein
MMGGTAAKTREEDENDRVIRLVLMRKLRANIPRTCALCSSTDLPAHFFNVPFFVSQHARKWLPLSAPPPNAITPSGHSIDYGLLLWAPHIAFRSDNDNNDN